MEDGVITGLAIEKWNEHWNSYNILIGTFNLPHIFECHISNDVDINEARIACKSVGMYQENTVWTKSESWHEEHLSQN